MRRLGMSAPYTKTIGASSRVVMALFFAAFFALILFLRLPAISENFCDPDLGTPAYAARLVLADQCPYAEAIVTKPPGSTWLYALVFSHFGLKLTPVYWLAALWTALSALVLFALGKRLAGRGAGLAAAGLYSLYQADLMSAGACPNFESWTILPCLLGLWALVGDRKTVWRLIVAGICLGAAIWMKQTAVAFYLGAVVFLAAEGLRQGPPARAVATTARGILWLTLGLILAALPFLLTLTVQNCLPSTLDALNPFQMQNYVDSADRQFMQSFAMSQFLRFGQSNLFLLLFSSAAAVWILFGEPWRRRLRERSALLVFLLGSLGSVFLGSRFYGHYFVVVLPYLCLLAGAAGGSLWPLIAKKKGTAMLLLVLAGAFIDVRPELVLGAQAWRGRQADGEPLTAAMLAGNREMKVDPGALNPLLNHLELQPTYRLVAAWARARLRPGETVWSLDYLPEMYFYTQALAPTRHQENFEWVTAAGAPTYGLWHDRQTAAVRENREELMTTLRARPPRFVFRYADDWPVYRDRRLAAPANWPRNVFGDPIAAPPCRVGVFPELETWLRDNYRAETVAGQNLLLVYEYSPAPPPATEANQEE